MVAGFKSERWPASNRNRWPECVGIRIHAKRSDHGGLDVAPRGTGDDARALVKRKPVAERRAQRNDGLELRSAARSICRRSHGLRRKNGLLWLAGMANRVRFFAPPYWKIEQAAKREARNSYYEG